MKKIYYWSPCLSKVGTINSTINSAIGMSKFFKKEFQVYVINSCGEWDKYTKYFESNNVKVVNLNFKYYYYLPKKGFVGSRISYIIIFLLSLIPLLNLLKKEKPEFIILHLITSLPLLLLSIFNFNTKFILRISGYPNLNNIRKRFWQSLSKKIYKVTTPTKDLLNQLSEKNIFNKEKIYYLPDAMINIKEFIFKQLKYKSKNEDVIRDKYFISVGRLTKQKNFSYLIKEFADFCSENQNYNLLIFGEGEEKKKLIDLIINKNLSNKIFLMGFTDNIYFYMKKSSGFILSSLWEEPGAVLMEAAISNTFIISSNCLNGPSEFLEKGKYGLLYESNKKEALKNKLLEFTNENNLFKKKIGAKKNSMKYTMFRHSQKLKKIIN